LPILCLALAIPFLREAQAYGNAFFAGLIVFVGLGWQLVRMSRGPIADSSPGIGIKRVASTLLPTLGESRPVPERGSNDV
jgi:hypothetical protein